uniref:Uncharacterized protein n=1 Tax=Astyanax mexicanus TaxID=7994 RepID=A0A8B9LSM9_ASTMX
MKTEWIVVLAVCLWTSAEGTFRPSASCVCHGKALYCVRDALGLRCENCQDNTEGRHCENCKEGYHHQRAGERCTPCYCNSIGSVGPGCNSRGQCVCKQGVQGARCDQCANGAPITSQGCEPQRQSTCFCNGHSDDCSLASGYAVYNITSAFNQGTEGWRAITAQGVNPSRVHFRWSPSHHDLEVIARDVLPVYLMAPAQYLGNQVLSYGQPLSFSLRLDRGVRYPSSSDVVLEGSGLKVSASLGDLRTVIPSCNCNPQGSVFSSCSDQGRCNCKEGFEGHKCEKSTCPSCFNPVKSQMEKYALKLKELEALFNRMSSGSGFSTDLTEAALSAAEDMVLSLEKRADTLTEAESLLRSKLSSLGNTQSRQEGTLQSISNTVENIAKQDQQHQTAVSDIQKLITDIRQNLLKARQDTNLIDFPLRDAEVGSNNMNSLVQKATDLAEQHQSEAMTIEQTANNALSDANKALALVSGIVDGENKVKEQINNLNNQFILHHINERMRNLEQLPVDSSTADLVARLDSLKDSLASNVSGYQELQKDILADQKETEDLLNKAKTAQQIQDKLLARANAAKAEADQAVKIFDSLDSVDEALDKIKGFEGQLNSNKASADEALSKLPLINSTIQQAAANNDKTQAVLADLNNFDEAVDTIEKLNNTLNRIEKMSGSLPPTADFLTTAIALKGGMEALNTQAGLTLNQLTAEKKNAEANRKLAEAVNQEANQAFTRATDTRNAVSDTLKTVNDLLGAIGNPGAVDEKRVSDLERAMKDSRSRVETDLRPRLRELEDTEAQQRDAITRMISDIDTILADIQNLEQIKRNILQLGDTCYNTSPNERP